MAAITNLDRARRALLTRHPFFAVALSQLNISITDAVPRAAVDTNGTILLNPTFIDETQTPQLAAVLAHETLHVLRGDFLRGKTKDRQMWNIAADLIINDLLENHSTPPLHLPKDAVRIKDTVWGDVLAKLKQSGIVPHEYDHTIEWSNANTPTERIYDLLVQAQEAPDGESDGQNQCSRIKPHDELVNAGTEHAQNQKGTAPHPNPLTSEKLQRIANIAAQAAKRASANKAAGALPGWLEEFVARMNTPSVDWRAVLREFVSSRAGADWVWSRPHIPTLTTTGCIAPSLQPTPTIGAVFILLDSSGSVDSTLLGQFWAEIRALKDEFGCTLHVGHFTTELERVDTYEAYDAPETITPTERFNGGTDIPAALRGAAHWCETSGVQPDAWLVLSDFHSPTPQEEAFGGLDGRVLWCYTADHGDLPAFGQVVEITTTHN